MSRVNSPKKRPLTTLPFSDSGDFREQLVRTFSAPQTPVLVVLVGNHTGKSVRLDGSIVVGRNPENKLVLTDSGVSWDHARIEDRGDAWAVIDLESTNGTLVNEHRVSEQVLQVNDKITFGRTTVRFEMHDVYDQAYDVALAKMLNFDDLSGLLVRRKFDAELEQMITTAQLNRSSVGLLVMDLDGLKKINDTHGHLFGAYTIAESGKLIGRVLGSNGIGSRFGGDEYLAALPNADLTRAFQVGEEIHAAINAYHFEREGILLHPGISIGVASFPAQAQDAKALFQAGDEAMYRAKQGGKNRVCI